MAPPMSEQTRYVIEQYIHRGESTPWICDKTGVHQTSVSRMRRNIFGYGTVAAPKRKLGRPRKLVPDDERKWQNLPKIVAIVIAFDLYGTLLSTESIAKELSSHFGDGKAASLAGLWRRYQLEYTWRLNSMNQYEPFSSITRNSLSQALADTGVSLDDSAIESLMKAYDSLSTFPDVPPALKALSRKKNITAVVFSNGTDSMVTNSVKSSPDLGPHAAFFKEFVTVEEVRCFKPDPKVYYHLAEKMGKQTTKEGMSSMWLVSGNPFDVVGARAVGMQAAWVDRAGNGWTDGLVQGESGRPTLVVKGLGDVVEGVKRFGGSR